MQEDDMFAAMKAHADQLKNQPKPDPDAPYVPWQFPEDHPERKICLTYWYPVVKELVKTPRTEIIPATCHIAALAYGEMPNGWLEFFDEFKQRVAAFGLPCFMRTSYTSGKHWWKSTCHLTSLEDVGCNLSRLAEYSELAGMMGLPVSHICLRELIPTKQIFMVLEGMPITREFRFFVKSNSDGFDLNYPIVEHVQPYWPPEAIKEPSITDWEKPLLDISTLSQQEYDFLAEQSCLVVSKLGDNWSVDWLQSETGEWFLIDMALADRSYRWEPPFTVVV